MNAALERAESTLELAEFQAVHKEVITARYPDILSYEGFVRAMPPTRYPLAPSHPFGPPVVSGTTVTVDQMLKSPTRITRMIMDITRERFIADRIFASGGGVTGGAVVYDQAQANE